MAITFSVGGQTVQVDGAASESTLQSLVSAVSGSNQRQRQAATQIAADLKNIGQSASSADSSMQKTAVSAQRSDAAISGLGSGISNVVSTIVGSFQQTSATVGTFADSLLSTSTQISQEWSRAFVSLSRGGIDPIVLSTSALRAGLDLTGGALGKLGSMIPGVPGQALSGFTNLVTELGKGGIDILSTQLIESAQAMSRYNKMGAIFSEGLGEMRVNTGKTGLTFEQFSRVVEGSRDNIKSFGGTLSDGITRLADVSNAMSRSVDSSGKTVRHALLNLGYSVEEQSTLAASYLAQQRVIVGIDRVRAMSSKEVADATVKYATDLKVLQELTGKDAKAIADKAAKDTMRASLMAKLTDDQRKALTEANRGMQQLGPEAGQTMQNALTRYLTTGTFDPAVAMSEEMRGYIVKIGQGVQSGSTDMQNVTTKANEDLKTELERQAKLGIGLAATTDTVLAAGGTLSSAVQTYTTAVNGILSNTNITAGATEKAQASAEKLKGTTEVLTTGVSTMTESSANMTKALNTITTEALPKVVPAVTALVKGVSNAAASFEQAVVGDITMGQAVSSVKKQLIDGFDGILKDIKQKVDEWFPSTKSGAKADTGKAAAAAESNSAPVASANTLIQMFSELLSKMGVRDSGTLGMTGSLFEKEDFYGKVAKGETVLTRGQFDNIANFNSDAGIGNKPQVATKPAGLAQLTTESGTKTSDAMQSLAKSMPNTDQLSRQYQIGIDSAIRESSNTMSESIVSSISAVKNNKADFQMLDGITQSMPLLGAAVTDSIKQSQDSYVTAMRDFQQERINADKQTKKSDQPFPEEFTAAVGKFDTVVLSTAIDNLSSQMVNSSKEQQLSLNAQITKLTELVTAMQENVRASENIANVLA
jgi:hypothetical protein